MRLYHKGSLLGSRSGSTDATVVTTNMYGRIVRPGPVARQPLLVVREGNRDRGRKGVESAGHPGLVPLGPLRRRARAPEAVVHRAGVQHPASHGRLALLAGGRLARARAGATAAPGSPADAVPVPRSLGIALRPGPQTSAFPVESDSRESFRKRARFCSLRAGSCSSV